MVRRAAAVDRGAQPATHPVSPGAAAGDLAPAGAPHRSSPGWRGGGGRWLVWAFRVLVWAVLLIIGYRGIMAIVLNETPPAPRSPAESRPEVTFPRARAAAFAMQFGQVYLNATPATAAQRASELAQFLPPGADPQLGWNRAGSLQLQSASVAGVAVRDRHHATVTLLARVNGGLMELGVPVFAAGPRMSVSGEPAWLPAPARAAPPSPPAAQTDTAAQAALQNQLPAFFDAYARGNRVTLARFLVPGAAVTGLGGQVAFGSLTAVAVPPGGPARHAVATVVWRVPGQPADKGNAARSPASLEMSYELTIVKLAGSWYVKTISPAARPTGP